MAIHSHSQWLAGLSWRMAASCTMKNQECLCCMVWSWEALRWEGTIWVSSYYKHRKIGQWPAKKLVVPCYKNRSSLKAHPQNAHHGTFKRVYIKWYRGEREFVRRWHIVFSPGMKCFEVMAIHLVLWRSLKLWWLEDVLCMTVVVIPHIMNMRSPEKLAPGVCGSNHSC